MTVQILMPAPALLVNADRSFWIETAIELIKHKDPTGALNPLLVIPWAEPQKVEWIVDQFTCIEMEEQEMVRGKKHHHYTHPQGEPDDALHAFIYDLIAEEIGRLPENQPLAIMDLYSGQEF